MFSCEPSGEVMVIFGDLATSLCYAISVVKTSLLKKFLRLSVQQYWQASAMLSMFK